MTENPNIRIALYRKGDALPSAITKAYIDSFAYQFFLNQPHHYIDNVTAEALLLSIDNQIISCTLSQNEYQDSYISSPYVLYFNYGLEEAKKIMKVIWHPLLWCVFKSFALLAKILGLNKAIQINNQFTASLVHPAWLSDSIADITHFLITKFPNHAIIVPRFSPELNPALMKKLQQLNYRFFSTSPIYIFDPQNGVYKTKRNTIGDRKLLAKGDYQIVNNKRLSLDEVNRINNLYKQLYIEKHSHFNPNFRISFWVDADRYHWLNFICLIDKASSIDAFFAYQNIAQVCLVSPVGFDTKIGDEMGLNRLICAAAIDYAEKNNLIFNYGPGSGKFKTIRGGEPLLNGNMVMYQHLPKRQKFIWWLFDKILNKYLAKYVDKPPVSS